MCTGKRDPNEIQQLVDAFYTDDPYYPHPDPDDPLYREFSNGYLSAHPKESRDAVDVGETFLRAIENKQQRPGVFPQIEFRYQNILSVFSERRKRYRV
jgi:hypothetical protein